MLKPMTVEEMKRYEERIGREGVLPATPKHKCLADFENAIYEAVNTLLSKWPGDIRDISREFSMHYITDLICWIEKEVMSRNVGINYTDL